MASVPVCNINDVQDGQIKEIEVEGSKILLVREDGNYYAFEAKCSHYGAPLAKGAYCKGIVRCPWHGACFNIKSGDIEDFPGFDGLKTYQVSIQDQNVLINLNGKTRSYETPVGPNGIIEPRIDIGQIVIAGGGAAGAACIESLRQNGFHGSIVLLTAEKLLPYDRPKLSKAIGIDSTSISLKNQNYYDKMGVTIHFDAKVVKLDTKLKTVQTASNRTFHYTKLVLATGGEPRKIDIPGANLANIFYLRSPDDGKLIMKSAIGKKVVIIGSSFIGLEVASFLVKKEATDVTVVSSSKTPFQFVFGEEIGCAIQKLFEVQKVKFHLATTIESLIDDGTGQICGLKLKNLSEPIPCQICIVGIGVEPATNYVTGSDIKMNSRKYIEVDKMLKTTENDVFAAGDIVTFPLSTFQNRVANVQHWQMAMKHGKTIGQIICGQSNPLHSVPFFWTAFFGKSIRYTGYGAGYDDVFIRGDLDKFSFVAYYLKNNQLVAVATAGRDPVASEIAERFRLGMVPNRDDIAKNATDCWK